MAAVADGSDEPGESANYDHGLPAKTIGDEARQRRQRCGCHDCGHEGEPVQVLATADQVEPADDAVSSVGDVVVPPVTGHNCAVVPLTSLRYEMKRPNQTTRIPEWARSPFLANEIAASKKKKKTQQQLLHQSNTSRIEFIRVISVTGIPQPDFQSPFDKCVFGRELNPSHLFR